MPYADCRYHSASFYKTTSDTQSTTQADTGGLSYIASLVEFSLWMHDYKIAQNAKCKCMQYSFKSDHYYSMLIGGVLTTYSCICETFTILTTVTATVILEIFAHFLLHYITLIWYFECLQNEMIFKKICFVNFAHMFAHLSLRYTCCPKCSIYLYNNWL